MSEPPTLGFIGLGAMGGAMARNLVAGGHDVIVFDLDAERIQQCVDAGARAATSTIEVVQQASVIFTSLTNSDVYVQVAENDLLPHASSGQIFVDLGTVMPEQIQRFADAFAAKGAHLLDTPVSGGVKGAEQGTLRLFVGGDEAILEQIRPLLTSLGDPNYIVYCGPSGSGQVVKFVNQMAMGLSSAAHLESLALGVKAGIDPSILARALGGDAGWREQLKQIAQQIDADNGDNVGVKFGQIPYFQAVANATDLSLPLSDALYAFCEPGERIVMEANRLSPSFWHELMKDQTKEEDTGGS